MTWFAATAPVAGSIRCPTRSAVVAAASGPKPTKQRSRNRNLTTEARPIHFSLLDPICPRDLPPTESREIMLPEGHCQGESWSLELLVLGAADDLVLELGAAVDEVVAVAGDPDDEVAIFCGSPALHARGRP